MPPAPRARSILRGHLRAQEALARALGRPGEPGLDHDFGELVDADPIQAHEDRGRAAEVRGREVDARIVGEQRLLGAEVLDASTEDRALRRLLAESLDFSASQRSLPHEQLVRDAPLAETARDPLARLRQRERQATD